MTAQCCEPGAHELARIENALTEWMRLGRAVAKCEARGEVEVTIAKLHQMAKEWE